MHSTGIFFGFQTGPGTEAKLAVLVLLTDEQRLGAQQPGQTAPNSCTWKSPTAAEALQEAMASPSWQGPRAVAGARHCPEINQVIRPWDRDAGHTLQKGCRPGKSHLPPGPRAAMTRQNRFLQRAWAAPSHDHKEPGSLETHCADVPKPCLAVGTSSSLPLSLL